MIALGPSRDPPTSRGMCKRRDRVRTRCRPDRDACIAPYPPREEDALVRAGTSVAETCTAEPGISPPRGRELCKSLRQHELRFWRMSLTSGLAVKSAPSFAHMIHRPAYHAHPPGADLALSYRESRFCLARPCLNLSGGTRWGNRLFVFRSHARAAIRSTWWYRAEI